MRKTILALLLFCPLLAVAHEYKLQNPPAIPYYFFSRLNVYGGAFNADGTVSGNISYYLSHTGCRFTCYNDFRQLTGTWDAQGNLLSQVDTPWPAQSPIATNGYENIYAYGPVAPNGIVATTGRDTRGFGYVDEQFSHYTLPPNDYLVIPDAPLSFDVTVQSDGDLPLNVSGITVTVAPSGYYTPSAGTATVTATTCQPDPVATGTSCTISILYDPTIIPYTGSPQGYAYTTLTLSLQTDAGNLPGWTRGFTITGVTPTDE